MLSLLGSLLLHLGALGLWIGLSHTSQAPASQTSGAVSITLVPSPDAASSSETQTLAAAPDMQAREPVQEAHTDVQPLVQATSASDTHKSASRPESGAQAPAQAADDQISTAAVAAVAAQAGPTSPEWEIYRRKLQAHIAPYKQYPDAARRQHLQGTVNLWFRLGRDGKVLAVHVENSSGAQLLDAEAVAAIERAQPLPAIPGSLPDSIAVLMPINFALNEWATP